MAIFGYTRVGSPGFSDGAGFILTVNLGLTKGSFEKLTGLDRRTG